MTAIPVSQLAERWNCTPQVIRRAIGRGQIKTLAWDGPVRIPMDEVERIEAGEL